VSLAVVVPTRDRPGSVGNLVRAFAATVTDRDTRLLLAVDRDDPSLGAYRAAVTLARHPRVSVVVVTGGSMVAALNEAAIILANDPLVDAVAFLGDDHRPRTRGWDTAYLLELHAMRAGIVYGDDLVQHGAIPTQCAMTSSIIRALGWMAPPEFHHLYVDDFWRDLGVSAGCLRYLPAVVVEHLHPSAGTAEWDAGYARVNAQTMYDADKEVFELMHTSGALDQAAATIRALNEEIL
jgi:GNAT superfamily N-acetyltransferase